MSLKNYLPCIGVSRVRVTGTFSGGVIVTINGIQHYVDESLLTSLFQFAGDVDCYLKKVGGRSGGLRLFIRNLDGKMVRVS